MLPNSTPVSSCLHVNEVISGLAFPIQAELMLALLKKLEIHRKCAKDAKKIKAKPKISQENIFDS